MRTLRGMAALLLGLSLVACGGGGSDAGNPPFGSGNGGGDPTTPAVAVVDVLASAPQVGSGGDEVTITAFVKGAGNVSLADTPVTFTTNSGTLSGITATTNAAGVATAKYSAGADKSNRSATVTVTAGGVSGSVAVSVMGTALSISGPTTLTLGDSATMSVKAVDSRNVPIPNLALTAASTLGNGLSSSTVTTDGQGNASLTYTATVAGSDTLSFTGAGASDSRTITVSGEDFKFVSPSANTQVAVGTPQVLTVRYLQNGVPQVGVPITFAATAGQLSSALPVNTNAQGEAAVTITSTSAAASTVQASLSQNGVLASATLPLQFVATSPAAVVLQVSPSSIAPNSAGSTIQQAQLQARVTDSNGNPVANRTVNFSRDADPSGGNLSQPSAVTDLNGLATVQYISGAQSTANDGVVLRATVAGTAVTDTATLSVNQTALFIALGTGNTISNIDPQTYKKDWVVYVTDSNGIAVPGVTLTIRVLPLEYRKGFLIYADGWVYGSMVACPSEDLNQNGILDTAQNEDVNGNGTLEPGNVISVTPGNIQTDATGRATISLIYAESYVPWVKVRLSATAIVAGTESSKQAEFVVDGLASDFSSETNPPAGQTSPFGTAASCADPN